MARDPASVLCHQVASTTFERIRADRSRTTVQVGELLRVIEERLFDPDLRVTSMQPGRKTDKRLITQFNQEIGLTPWAYITQCRMEIAGRMLASSEDIPVWRVGTAVGYLTSKSFGRVFKRWAKVNPREFRQQAHGERVSHPSPRQLLTPDEIQRAVRGDLPPGEAAALASRLSHLQDQIRSNYQLSSTSIPQAESIEPMMARNVWRWIKDQPQSVQEAAIESQAAAFRTPALFHLMCTKSIEAGLEDDVLGMQLANLALLCMTALLGKLDEVAIRIPLIRGHLLAGLAMFRCGNTDEALQYYGIALHMLEVTGKDAHPLLVMELCLYRALVEFQRGNLEDGRMLASEGLKIMRVLIDHLEASTEASEGVET